MEEKESCHISDLLNQICSVYTWVELPCSLKKKNFSHFYLCFAVKLPRVLVMGTVTQFLRTTHAFILGASHSVHTPGTCTVTVNFFNVINSY